MIEWLAMRQPAVHVLERLSEVVREQWATREQRTRPRHEGTQGQFEEIRRLNSAAIKATLKGELSTEDFESLKATNTDDTAKIQQEITASESERSMMQEFHGAQRTRAC